VGGATPSTRLCAIGLAAALVAALLLWAAHGAKVLADEPGEPCDLCLSLANVDHALVDTAAPPPVPDRSAVHHRPAGRAPLAVLLRDQRARSPPRYRV
jgi:hypothetical protein